VSGSDRLLTVALDLLGGEGAPAAVVDGALLACAELPDLAVTLVGPPDLAAKLLAGRPLADRLDVVAATESIGMAEDPARAVRAKRDATVRVAARLVRDGAADATVSMGSTGAAVAAALLVLGRLPGMSRPALAVVVPAAHGPVVLLDAGAGVHADPDRLAQFAMAGVAYAQIGLGIENPRVGLLSMGEEPGKGDQLRKDAHQVLAELPIRFVGNVEGHDVPLGERADVVVTDGFTGNVLLKGLEGMYRLVLGAIDGPARIDERLEPDRLGGAILLGVNGVAVIGHGAANPRAIASGIRIAARAATEGLVVRTGAVLADLLSRRTVGAAR